MKSRALTTIVLVMMLVGAIGCAQTAVTPLPQTVRRVAVLPPYQPGVSDTPDRLSDVPGLLSRTVSDLVGEQARARLAEKGFDVVPPSIVELATNNRIPTSPQMAAQIAREGNLDAAVLYIEIRRWQPMPYERGMKADGIIVALDATLINPQTGAILWEVHRPSRPVPLYGVVLTGHANVFVAETVMKEIFGSAAARESSP